MVQQSRKASRRTGDQFTHPAKGGVHMRRGGLCVLDAAGFAQPGHEAANLTVAGVAQETIDNRDGADGALSVSVVRGKELHFLSNDSADPVTREHLNKPCYIVDDETVSSSHKGNTRSQAGIIRDLTGSGIWAEFI
ncbi:hypothetical protein [Pseudovibrio sp. Tun.PSC04-5.I4]|uniref:hypothetical protein n=1 Tax=Pseudovibrio sp. Tun.PSC04-5.I4 TaxID=1798213 RepID=UPI00087E159C|nr:hypothetical protein [Pseudovibrio sp. Tun.PSC04-5.I4]SDR07711.1 hypothetical protein SAMN04515695_2633 [Pseudovibrio sp. Tun.PSC04-5.I4]